MTRFDNWEINWDNRDPCDDPEYFREMYGCEKDEEESNDADQDE